MPQIEVCENCGQSFKRKSGTKGRFCSAHCWYEYKKAHPKTKLCPICGKQYRSTAETCSKNCGYVLRRSKTKRRANCEVCGKPLPPNVKPRVRFCSRHCAMVARNKHGGHTIPEGGKYIDGTGYVRIKTKQGWLQEHRLIMEQILGRPLEPTERVHHKNSIRNDNRPENLELWSVNKKDPPGKRIIDWVIDFLRKQGWEIKEPNA